MCALVVQLHSSTGHVESSMVHVEFITVYTMQKQNEQKVRRLCWAV